MIKFDEYIQKIRFAREKINVVMAYSDCLPGNVDTEGLVRNLSFICLEPFSLKDAKVIMSLACPDGYNDFDVNVAFKKIEDLFGEDCKVMLARESSVCIYVRPASRVWLSRDSKMRGIADEVSFEPGFNAFRLWWD